MQRKQHLRLTRAESVLLLVIVGALVCIFFLSFEDKKKLLYTTEALGNVQALYNQQVVRYFSTRSFAYSATRVQGSHEDFKRAKPKSGEEFVLEGFSEANDDPEKPAKELTDWTLVGFPLQSPSYFIYRVEPEFAYASVAKPKDGNGHYHFHAVAIADIDGDSWYEVLARSAYIDEVNFFRGSAGVMASEGDAFQ